MRYFTLVIICIIGILIQGYGQSGPINIIRYLDDFSYLLESDTLARTKLEKLIYIYTPLKIKISIFLSEVSCVNNINIIRIPILVIQNRELKQN